MTPQLVILIEASILEQHLRISPMIGYAPFVVLVKMNSNLKSKNKQ